MYAKGKDNKYKFRIFNIIEWESGGVLEDKQKSISNVQLLKLNNGHMCVHFIICYILHIKITDSEKKCSL